MNTTSFELPENPALEAVKSLDSLLQKVEWHNTIDWQQRLLDAGSPMCSIFTEYSNILSCIQQYITGFNGLAAGLAQYNILAGYTYV